MKARVGAILAVILFTQTPANAERRVADRIVARVNSKPILLSEIRQRLRPVTARSTGAPAWQRAELARRASRDLLERRIDEILLAEMAERHHVSVEESDIDATLAAFAKDGKRSVDEIMTEALRAGYSERDYRREIRYQLLEQRVIYAVADMSAFPKQESARSAWYEREKKKTLARAREQACIERLSR